MLVGSATYVVLSAFQVVVHVMSKLKDYAKWELYNSGKYDGSECPALRRADALATRIEVLQGVLP